jgi:hypothetical protein
MERILKAQHRLEGALHLLEAVEEMEEEVVVVES